MTRRSNDWVADRTHYPKRYIKKAAENAGLRKPAWLQRAEADPRISYQHVINALGCEALYVVGTKAPVPRKFGDNRGGRPIHLGTTSQWNPDNTTSRFDAVSPYVGQGVLLREWVPSRDAVWKLLQQLKIDLVLAYQWQRIEREDWWAGKQQKTNWLEPAGDPAEFDIDIFRLLIRDTAERLKIETWGDGPEMEKRLAAEWHRRHPYRGRFVARRQRE